MSELFHEPRTIKALSLWQPWAWLIAVGVKRHETRHWMTAYLGPIAIHAAKRLDRAGAPHELCVAAGGRDWEHAQALGAIVAIGELTAVRSTDHMRNRLRVDGKSAYDHLTASDRAAGDFSRGRFAWAIDKVRPLKAPIPTVGRQGLFDWTEPHDIGGMLMPELNHAECSRLIGWA